MSDPPRTPDDLAALVGDRERTAGLGPPMAIVPPGYPSRTAAKAARCHVCGLVGHASDCPMAPGAKSSLQRERDARVDDPPERLTERFIAEERRHRELIAQLEHIVDHQQKTIDALTAAVQLLRSIDRRVGT